MSTIIIESIKKDGSKFRPSDWIERLSDSIGTFESGRPLHFSKKCKSGVVNGEKCLILDDSLEDTNKNAFNYIMDFVKSNNLRYN